jgi:hypothetical protein
MSDSFVGKKNVYVCRKCETRLVTIDKHEGTTPFLTGCVEKNCGGISESQLYRVDQELEATHEWYRALEGSSVLKHVASRHHHQMGGLFLRRICQS